MDLYYNTVHNITQIWFEYLKIFARLGYLLLTEVHKLLPFRVTLNLLTCFHAEGVSILNWAIMRDEMWVTDVKKYRYCRYLHNIRNIDIKIDIFDSIVCFFLTCKV